MLKSYNHGVRIVSRMGLFGCSSRKRFLSKKDSGATTYFEIRTTSSSLRRCCKGQKMSVPKDVQRQNAEKMSQGPTKVISSPMSSLLV